VPWKEIAEVEEDKQRFPHQRFELNPAEIEEMP
jgi:hypothetical protein